MKQTVTDCLNMYVATGSGFVWNLIVTFVLYALWGVATFSVLEYFMDDSDVMSFSGGISFMVGVTAIAVFKWISDAFLGYTEREAELQKVLTGTATAFRRLGEYTKGNIRGIKEGALWPYAKDSLSTQREQNTYDRAGSDDVFVRNVEQEVLMIKRLLTGLAFYSFRLYIDHDSEHLNDRTLLTDISYPATLTTTITNAVRDSTKVKLEHLASELNVRLSKLHRLQGISGDQFYSISKVLHPVCAFWQGPTLTPERRGLRFYYNWLTIVVFSQFLILLPFEMFLRIRYLMVYFYPVIMTAFNGLYIARKWLGDLLDQRNPYGTVRYFIWRRQTIEDIQKEYDSVANALSQYAIDISKERSSAVM